MYSISNFYHVIIHYAIFTEKNRKFYIQQALEKRGHKKTSF